MYNAIQLAKKPGKSVDTTVCLVFKNPSIHADDAALDDALNNELTAATKRTECSGGNGNITFVYANDQRVALLGLGEADDLDAQTLRVAGYQLVKALCRVGAKAAHVSVNAAVSDQISNETFGQALTEGVVLGSFKFDEFKSADPDDKSPQKLAVSFSDTSATAGAQVGQALGEAANYARTLATTPPNIATTTWIASQAESLAKSNKLKCSVIKGAALKSNKLQGLINVGKASENPPCLIQLTYTPAGKSRNVPTVLLVGKTITYDTGGLSLKISNGMKGMKYDKCGGMAVLGAMHAIAKIKPACQVIALLPTAENSVAGNAYRPDDVIEYLNGVTVEVTNTDAEGRIVLADALAYGCKKHKPDAVIDLATLTGGVVVALGRACAGFWCEDDDLTDRLQVGADASGERIWRLPLYDDYIQMMKSKHADIWNSAPVREAHPIQGAAFLSHFVEEGVPWAHIDIAGPADYDKNVPPIDAGPSGFGVRLILETLRNWSS